jgi:metallo-beta-lactamase class B
MTVAVVAGHAQAHQVSPDEPVDCEDCQEWNKPVKPFNVAGNTWYVGVKGVTSILLTGPRGHILLDGDLPQSAPLIEANIKALGFRIEDVKLIVNSHAHWDHAGGIAALQRDSDAVVAASAWGAQVLQNGTSIADDPQYQAKPVIRIAKIAKVRVVRDGETLTVGPLAVTAHMTPGHTPGSTTWTWSSCEGHRCYDVVYADSLTAYASGDFKFSGDGKTPDISASFAASIAKVAAMKCDIVISVHPDASKLLERAAAPAAAGNPALNRFVDRDGCRKYAANASAFLAGQLASERGMSGKTGADSRAAQ